DENARGPKRPVRSWKRMFLDDGEDPSSMRVMAAIAFLAARQRMILAIRPPASARPTLAQQAQHRETDPARRRREPCAPKILVMANHLESVGRPAPHTPQATAASIVVARQVPTAPPNPEIEPQNQSARRSGIAMPG
ncbi:MAG: hypothetical protein OXD42_10395, partial [Rhodospirillaceae bacterium]|nr:hypothetical protein [Rhodospirillaceae bacterium]